MQPRPEHRSRDEHVEERIGRGRAADDEHTERGREYHRGEERALLAAVVLATSLGVFIIGRAATADALLNMLIAASMFGAWLHLSTGERRWLYATHAAIGLGVLAKGPIAILVPFATTFLFC